MSDTIRFLEACCYHAAPGFIHHLEAELPEAYRRDNELLTIMGPERKAYWVRNIWQKPFTAEFDSISDASRILRGFQRNWAPYPTRLARRTMLIADALPRLPSKPKSFPFYPPPSPMGAFALLDEHTLMASAQCSSPWPNGELDFAEDKEGPPSRAYRKLWEALVMAGSMPGPGQRCVDAGACPGGWTWALAGLGAQVLAIDRAAIDDRIAAMPGVSFLKHNAFTLKPEDIGPVDWFCSDVICYPPVLYDWVLSWLESGLARNFICTIKMQGKEWDRPTVERFAAIPGSRVLHLWHNKHELTWILTEAERLRDA
ncbi:MAG: SAM-dependent methyltransferase [Spirochaetia bacterium]|jgi:23S rRNA (cytidine2498-2'-O)-methyltransferase|nr:SAM-dependent methyltransferase [Spirochaetia bacterium]